MIQTRFFSILFCASLPICTFLIVPSIEGTLMSYVVGLGTVPFIMFGWAGIKSSVWNSYIKTLAYFFVFWLFFLGASQLGNYLGDLHSFEYLNLIKPEIHGILFRKTLFTQSLYFLACVSIFLYFRYILPKDHIKYLQLCCWVFLTYGFYEWAFYLFFGYSGDFIANRKMEEAIEGSWSGSWLQPFSFFGYSFMRFKSTFGEASFFSLACVPFFFVNLILNNRLLILLLFVAIVLTISTSAYLGVLIGLITLLFLQRRLDKRFFIYFSVLLFLFLLAFFFKYLDPQLFDSIFSAKFTGEVESGARRYQEMYYFDRAYAELTPWQKTFGIGLGYTYNSVLKANIVNFGFLGTVIFSFFVLFPFVKSFCRMNAWAFSAFIIFCLFAINVAELYQPITWALLGLAWRDDLDS